MPGLVVVALGGPTPDTPFLRDRIAGASLRIAADAGAQRLAELGLQPDLLTGDFDSLSEPQREAALRAGAKIVPHPDPQQITDGAAALRLAAQRGADTIVVLGAHGGARLDHSLGNLLILFDPALRAIPVIAVDGWNEAVPLHTDGQRTVTFSGRTGDYVSVVPISDHTRLTTHGLRWPLNDAPLECGSSHGLSNELTGAAGGITLHTGAAIAVHVGSPSQSP